MGGGVSRRGQVHGELVALSGAYVSLSEGGCFCRIACCVWLNHATCVDGLTHSGKVLSGHTQCRAGLPAQEEFVRVTCHVQDLSLSRVAPDGDLPENLRMTAPRILIPLLFTACICMVTGISLSLRPRRRMTLMLAKQLWQPVSAIAESRTGVSGNVGGCIPVLCSLRGGQSL